MSYFDKKIPIVVFMTASCCFPMLVHTEMLPKKMLDKVYGGYDEKHNCWLAIDDDQRYCMKIDRTDKIATVTGDRLYVLVTGNSVDEKGETDVNHVILGLVGAFVIEERNDHIEIIAGNPKISVGAYGQAPTQWKLIKLGPSDYWGWQNTWGDCHQGYCGSRYAILAPYNKTVRDLANITASFSDEGNCGDEKCLSTTIDSSLKIDSTRINDKVFPLLITVTGTSKGKKLSPKTWTLPFNVEKWSYSEPKNWLLKDREF